MRKTRNVGGDTAFAIKTEHIVTARHFAYALAHHCWNEKTSFNPKMKKSEAMTILKESLFHYGLQGQTDFTIYEGSDAETTAGFDNAYPSAREWVIKNYPYLKEKEVGNDR